MHIDVSTQCTLLATNAVGWPPLGTNTYCQYLLVASEGQCTPLVVSGIATKVQQTKTDIMGK